MPVPLCRVYFRPLRKAVWVWLLAGFAWVPCKAAAPNYSIRTWAKEDGLPQNSVTALVQTHDGYLWLGTYAGLVRFDGVRFTVFDNESTPSLKNGRITSLYEDPGHTLWIGHETGDLTRLRAGRFEGVEIPGGWNGGKILRIGTDEKDSIWIMNKEGLLARVSDGCPLAPDESTRAAPGLVRMAKDKRGKLWIVRGGQLGVLENGQFALVELEKPNVRAPVEAICPSRDGGVWVVHGRKLRKWKNGAWAEGLLIESEVLDAVTALQETPEGGFLVGTPARGLYLFNAHAPLQHFTQTNGLAQNWIACFCIDAEGNIWVGSGNGGLSMLRPVNFERVNPPDKWNGMAVLSVTMGRKGDLWVGTEGAGLYHLEGSSWSHFAGEDGLANRFVWSVLEDTNGQLWVGTWGGGLFVRRGDRFELARGLEKVRTPVPALLQGREGQIWAGTGSGLLRYEEGKATWFGAKKGLKVPDVRTVYEDGGGSVWFGMQGGGLASLKDGQLRQYRKEDGLASDFVLCFHPDGEALWIGTGGGGLNRFKRGQFASVGPRDGLPRKVISHIEEDGQGDFWMSTEAGIMRMSKSALNRCADFHTNRIDCQLYGLGDGLETIDCSTGSQPAGCKTPDGRLWFPTRKGLVVVDPTNLTINPRPPPVVIEELLVDGKVQSPKSTSPDVRRWEIPPGGHRFEFRYTALSFAAPEKVHFKYRLEGLEPEWMDGQTSRSVSYSYLPPGDYCLHVIACNNDGFWNEQGTSLPMTVLPFFWQTWWFRILAYVAGATLVAGIAVLEARRWHRRKLEQIERQRALERERARIAKDIHDDLGASLTRIAMLTQSAQKDLQEPQQTAGHLGNIYSTARELTRAMDEIVWAVNPKHDTLDSVATYLVRFAQDFLAPAGIRCRLDLPVQLPTWSLTAEIRHNLFLAFKEALHNVIRHAAASEVRISLKPEPANESFLLCVEDNGKGFIEGEASAQAGGECDRLSGGNGLGNMRRRMEEVGGSCAIESAPGKGTKVKFMVAVKTYAVAR